MTARSDLRHRTPEKSKHALERAVASLRRIASMRLLPRRRITPAEREAIERRIVEDPVVLEALGDVIARRPQFSRKRDLPGPIQDRA